MLTLCDHRNKRGLDENASGQNQRLKERERERKYNKRFAFKSVKTLRKVWSVTLCDHRVEIKHKEEIHKIKY